MNVIHYEYRQIAPFRRVYTVKNDIVRSFAFRQGGLLYFRKNRYEYTIVSVDDIICIV
jgi:hypothetical protein